MSRSHVAQAQVLGTFKEVLGGRKPTQPPVIFRARAEALRFPQGAGRHPHHLTVRSPPERVPNGKKEAPVLLRGFLLNGFFRWDGLFCLLVFKKEIYVVNTLFAVFRVSEFVRGCNLSVPDVVQQLELRRGAEKTLII